MSLQRSTTAGNKHRGGVGAGPRADVRTVMMFCDAAAHTAEPVTVLNDGRHMGVRPRLSAATVRRTWVAGGRLILDLTGVEVALKLEKQLV